MELVEDAQIVKGIILRAPFFIAGPRHLQCAFAESLDCLLGVLQVFVRSMSDLSGLEKRGVVCDTVGGEFAGRHGDVGSGSLVHSCLLLARLMRGDPSRVII